MILREDNTDQEDSAFGSQVATAADNHYVFDSSRARQKALMFKLGEGQLIEGLEQAVAKMSTGQICLFTVPPSLGYGVNGYLPVVPPNATLYYEVELVAFSFEDDKGHV